MRQIIIATAIILPCACAQGAEPMSSSILQTFNASQVIHQSISADGAEDDLAAMTQKAAEVLRQYGQNATNLVSSGSDLQTVTQRFNGVQSIHNEISGLTLREMTSVDQSGANLAGVIDGQTVDLAVQAMGGNAVQEVFNLSHLAGAIGSVRQSGMNTANMAIAEYSIGTGDQEIVEGAVQHVDNRLVLAAGASIAQFIEQSGSNFGNVMVSDKVDRVTRLFAGTQIVENTVVLADVNSVPPISQSGVNVANSLSANQIGAIHQISKGQQIVINKVLGPDGQPITDSNIDQSTSNIVNLVTLGPLPASERDDPPPVDVVQEADFPQDTQGGSNHTQAGNVLSISR